VETFLPGIQKLQTQVDINIVGGFNVVDWLHHSCETSPSVASRGEVHVVVLQVMVVGI